MPASYPASVRLFSTKRDINDVIFAEHPNSLQEEIAAIQTFTGLNPHISTAPNPAGTFIATASVFASLAARLANIETGVVSDSHTQYLRLTGGALTGALTVPSPLTVRDGTLSKAAGGVFSLSAGLAVSGSVSATTTVTGTTGVFDGGNRVYSANNPPPSGQSLSPDDELPSIGSRSAGTRTTYSRGDHSHGPSSTKGFTMTMMGA